MMEKINPVFRKYKTKLINEFVRNGLRPDETTYSHLQLQHWDDFVKRKSTEEFLVYIVARYYNYF